MLLNKLQSLSINVLRHLKLLFLKYFIQMKNQLLFSTLLLIASGAFAQLTVQPTAGGQESFIYVNDQVLFVKDKIALTKNSNANNLEASIYLRNNGQLIQGNDSAENSGDGQLSVQQTSPETNKWAYYYWCSPIGNPANSTTGNKNFGINFLYEPDANIVTAAKKVLTTPSHDGLDTTDPITVSTRWLYTHPEPGTEAEVYYLRMNNGNNAAAGKGFTMKGVGTGLPGGTQKYEFRGRPNNGSFTINVKGPEQTFTAGQPDPSLTNAVMTLSGNPYPSALDLNRVFHESGNEPISAFYFYDEDRTVDSHYYSEKPFGYGVFVPGSNDFNGNIGTSGFQTGSYVNAPFYIWNSGGGSTSTTGIGDEDLSHRFAPIGQGIMFVGTNSVADSITIKNSHRRYIKDSNPHSVFHRPNNKFSVDSNREYGDITANLPSQVDNRTPQTRFYAVFDEAITREVLLTFSNQSTDGYDRGMDGLSPMGLKTDAYFPVGDDNNRLPYVINSVKYDENKQIPFAFKLNKTTQIRLSIAEEVKRPYEKVYLFDRQENIYRRIGPQNTIPFLLSLPAGNYDNRFFIVFKKAEGRQTSPSIPLDEQDKIIASVDFFQNNPQRQLEISNPEGYTLKSTAVYDMNGKLVIQEQNLGANNKYSFYTGNLSDGVYLVKLITAQDISIDYKAIVHNK